MAWIRATEEHPERRPTDIALLIVTTVLAIMAGIWAQTQSVVDLNLFRAINGLSDDMNGLARAFFAPGSVWALLVVVAVLVVSRQSRIALRVALAGGAAWGIAELLHRILGDHSIHGLGVNVRFGDPPAFPSVNVAIITAMAVALSPYVVRPLRRILFVVVVLVALAAMYLGTALPSDVLGGVLLGLAAGAMARVILGSPGGRPTVAEVWDALTDLGYHVSDVHLAALNIPRASAMDVTVDGGERLRVDAFGRDQRDARIASKVWRWLMYKEPGVPVFGSRMQQVEHIAYTLMLADRADVHAARLVKTGVGGTDSALLITDPPTGTRLGELDVEKVTDDVLTEAWTQLGRLHDAGISHGHLDGLRVLVADDGTVAFDDFSAADATANRYWCDRDDAALMVTTALIVGNERAVAAAVGAMGGTGASRMIPVVQPAAMPPGVGTGTKHLAKTLKGLRADLAKATGVEDVPPSKIKRLSLVNVGMLVGVVLALTIAVSSLQGMNWASVQREFQNAAWGWAVLTFVLYPLVPMAWATALMGCVNKDLPFVPTVLTQLACSFLNLITPNGIGGTALQIDYLHKQDVPVASGGSAMVLSTGVGGAIQVVLFLIAITITATAIDTSGRSTDNTSLWVIALGAAAVGIVLFIPKIRGKVVPAVKRAAADIWAVLRTPKKAMQLVGGDLAGNLIYPALLGLCLLAFHQRLDYAQLVCVQVGAGMIGNVAPVPGGIGVQEAALTAGLTSFGVPSTAALAAVIVFRGITFAIPPVAGFFTLRWLRAKGYA